jgi:CheY-like chemotaxis protein
LGSRILIVEDEQIIAEDLAMQIGRLGHQVLGISISGEEAVAMADRTKPELVLMDIQLEGRMTGTEAAQVIRQRTGAAIVFVTAFPGVLLRENSHLKEPSICVNKPFSRTQLEAALRAAAASRQRPAESS